MKFTSKVFNPHPITSPPNRGSRRILLQCSTSLLCQVNPVNIGGNIFLFLIRGGCGIPWKTNNPSFFLILLPIKLKLKLTLVNCKQDIIWDMQIWDRQSTIPPPLLNHTPPPPVMHRVWWNMSHFGVNIKLI